MKKKLVIAAAAVLLIAVLFCLYMETHFTMSTMVETGLSEKKILREMPEIAITEQDLAMAEELFAAPEVQEAFIAVEESGALGCPVSDAASLLVNWTPEGFDVMEVAVSDHKSLYVSFLKEDEAQSIYYVFFEDGAYSPQKSIGVYGRTLFHKDDCKAVYQNVNGEITKMKHKHIWFAWLTEEL
ncbi:MAG: hypothetical protein IKU81_03360 [Oscillibacter sp.]|nr:hypothetical protein [Oscillibacter sp.]